MRSSYYQEIVDSLAEFEIRILIDDLEAYLREVEETA